MASNARRLIGPSALFWVICVAASAGAAAIPEDAEWIWSPAHQKSHVPQGDCYFRKTFTMGAPEQGSIKITCDDHYELYVNGQLVGSGEDWKTLDEYDITTHLVEGENVIGVKATNSEKGSAGLAAQVLVKQQGNTHVAFSTNSSWKSTLKPIAHWMKSELSDSEWMAAQSLGRLGATRPWGNQAQAAGEYGRFRTQPEFAVEWVVAPEETGSLIAMTFDEFGQIIASREGGPLLRIRDDNADGVHDSVEVCSDLVKNCQGILPLNGDLFVVGDGPEGAALYRLSDENKDKKFESADALLKFKGRMSEHGPHTVTLGPEGLIYVAIGNHGSLEKEFSSTSPYHDYYEGDLIKPRHEDPRGHAAGIKVPGGVILRTDASGSFAEVIAGGLRNPYDIAFNREGDLFTYDADMEWDIGLPWYRPSRINHVTAGAEYGWRSGWSKWPEYYLDSLPATLNIGPGSPTGVEFYNHVNYPVRYHNALFACDWALGRINVVRLNKQGGSYRGQAEVFVEGKPLNVTDITVGPDGWLYFCTGGRGTGGGVYRVVWTGKVPPQVADRGDGIQQAILQPQLQSAWSRQQIARIQNELDDRWEVELIAIAQDVNENIRHRIRALDLLQLFGPSPPLTLLMQLSKDESPEMRAKIAYLLGIEGDVSTATRLVQLLDDADPMVRRVACESLVRFQVETSPQSIVRLLADPDRTVSFAARRALEMLPAADWQNLVLDSPSTRTFLMGATALLVAHPREEVALVILDRCSRMIGGDVEEPGFPRGYLSDRNFVDLLRVIQLALVRGKIKPGEVPELGQQLAREYPSRSKVMNRELVRLLTFLEEPSAVASLVRQLSADLPMVERIQIGMHAASLKEGWTTPQKLELLRFYERARATEGGLSLEGYIDRATRSFTADFTDSQRDQVLTGGTEWPSAALAVLVSLPPDPGRSTLRQIRQLDQKLVGIDTDAAKRLRVGNIAVLGRSKDKYAMLYLRDQYWRDPSRREALAMGLAQDPDGANWPLLVRSLSVVDGAAAREVTARLNTVARTPKQAEPIRQAILLGLRNRETASETVVQLLKNWTGESVNATDDSPSEALAKWQAWFEEKYPLEPAPHLPEDSETNKWSYQELHSFLESVEGQAGDPQRGAIAFKRAQCAKCHRFGNDGDRTGPDLTTISRRFHKKEILEAILFPSHVISDQYESKTVVTTDGRTLTGILAPSGPDQFVLLKPDGEQMEIVKEEIEATKPSKTSVMPEGLLNGLTLQEVADLFAYLGGPSRPVITHRRRVRSMR